MVLSRPWFIVAVALALRCAWALVVPVEPVSDSVLYDAFARSIVEGKGYAFPAGNLTVYWPVGTSAFYAAVYAVAGTHPLAIALVQAVLGAVTVLFAWILARRLAGKRAGAVAAWMVALWPLLVQFTTVLASETLFVFLLLAALVAWTGIASPVPRAVAWGGLIALATYVRPTAWPLLLLFPLVGWLAGSGWRRAAVVAAVSIATAAALHAPWVWRNVQLFDKFVLVAANNGANLWMGNNPASQGGYMELPERTFSDEIERDRHYGREAMRFIRENPARYAQLSLARARATFDRESIGVVWNEPGLVRAFGERSLLPLKVLSSGYWWLALLAGLAGTVVVLRRGAWRTAWPVLIPLALFAAVPILTVGQDRYHMPLDPLLAVLAGAGWALARQARDRSGQREERRP